MTTPLSVLSQPHRVNERFKRLRVINDTLQRTWGFEVGGSAQRASRSGRRGMYDIFNDTREVATARHPFAQAGTIARHPVGHVAYIIPRMAEKLPLYLEELHELRRTGGPIDEVDENGETYIFDQEQVVKQRITNLREFQTAAMMRGSYTYTVSGDELTHGFSGGSITIDFQMPAGNKSQLDMLGAGDIIGTAWDNAAAPIITDLFQINAAFNQLVGSELTDVYVTSIVWGFVLANTQVQNQAGSVNQVFDFITRDSATHNFQARLKAAPWVTWHINDNGVNLDGTFTKLIGDTDAAFVSKGGPDATGGVPMIADYMECSEPVIEYEGAPPMPRLGTYVWHKPISDPAVIEIHSRHNGMPRLHVPSAVAYATVDF